MTREELIELHETVTLRCREIMKEKNHDYAGETGTKPFANFERCETLDICKTQTGFLVRLTDKFSRLITYVNSGKLIVKGEGYEDAIFDMLNYLILLYAFEEERKTK